MSWGLVLHNYSVQSPESQEASEVVAEEWFRDSTWTNTGGNSFTLRCHITVNENNPNEALVYTLETDEAIFRTTDRGETWQELNFDDEILLYSTSGALVDADPSSSNSFVSHIRHDGVSNRWFMTWAPSAFTSTRRRHFYSDDALTWNEISYPAGVPNPQGWNDGFHAHGGELLLGGLSVNPPYAATLAKIDTQTLSGSGFTHGYDGRVDDMVRVGDTVFAVGRGSDSFSVNPGDKLYEIKDNFTTVTWHNEGEFGISNYPKRFAGGSCPHRTFLVDSDASNLYLFEVKEDPLVDAQVHTFSKPVADAVWLDVFWSEEGGWVAVAGKNGLHDFYVYYSPDGMAWEGPVTRTLPNDAYAMVVDDDNCTLAYLSDGDWLLYSPIDGAGEYDANTAVFKFRLPEGYAGPQIAWSPLTRALLSQRADIFVQLDDAADVTSVYDLGVMQYTNALSGTRTLRVAGVVNDGGTAMRFGADGRLEFSGVQSNTHTHLFVWNVDGLRGITLFDNGSLRIRLSTVGEIQVNGANTGLFSGEMALIVQVDGDTVRAYGTGTTAPVYEGAIATSDSPLDQHLSGDQAVFDYYALISNASVNIEALILAINPSATVPEDGPGTGEEADPEQVVGLFHFDDFAYQRTPRIPIITGAWSVPQ